MSYVVKAALVTFINSELLKDELLNCLELLITGGFNVRAVICDNHAANVSAFTKLILQFGEDNESLFINFQSQKVYLFYNTIHLIKNVRNNLLSTKRLVFPQFNFSEFNDDVIVNRVLLNHAPTSTQLHPPPPSSFQPPRSSLQHPQQYLNQNIASNWAISPNLGQKIKSCPI